VYLKTVKDSEINKVSPVITDYLKKKALKPGETAQYRLLTGVKNTDKDKTEGEFLFGAVQCIVLKDTIRDKGSGQPVTIAVIKNVGKDGNITPGKLYVKPRKNDGSFKLSGDNPGDVEIYYVLELLSQNKSNPFATPGVIKIFERIDELAEANQRSRVRNMLQDSWNAIDRWNKEETQIRAAAYNISTQLDVHVLKDKLKTIAERAPEEFYETIDSEETMTKALIKMAKEAGVISYNTVEMKWYLSASGETLALLERREGANETDQFAQILLNGVNGPAMKGKIETLLKKANKAVKQEQLAEIQQPVVSEETVEEEMQPVENKKNRKPERYAS
jgi:hypothetical protein